MVDPRNKKLADILVNYSIQAQENDKVWLKCTSSSGLPLVREIYKILLAKNCIVFMQLGDETLDYLYFKLTSPKILAKEPEPGLFLANWADKSITIVAEQNSKELANIEPEKQALRSRALERIREISMGKKWVLTFYPTSGMAYASAMSLHELEDFYFNSCLKDWAKENQKMQKIKNILDKSKIVRLLGYKTDLEMSFVDRKFAICSGQYNMPDGEIFGGPLENYTRGEVYFDFPSLYQGKEVKGVRLKFNKGRVVAFSSKTHGDFLKKILSIDQGAKVLGEFGVGTNFEINKFMTNTLFDEKMGGTIHLALGCSFTDKVDGWGNNKSAIHWDLIKNMKKEGSKILVDGKIILKDGKFVGY